MADPKQQIMDQVRQQAALSNARALVDVCGQDIKHRSSELHQLTDCDPFQKLNEHCFERCVPKPGTSLSSGETTCYQNCMEKYMAAWNTVSRQYLQHVQKGVAGGAGGNALGGI